MIHITRNRKKQFYVVLVAKNGEVLSTSKPLTSRANAFKNIQAQCKQFGSIAVAQVQDDTPPTPTSWLVDEDNKLQATKIKPVPRYDRKRTLQRSA